MEDAQKSIQDKIKEQSGMLGQRLALLISLLNITDEQKGQLVKSLENMNSAELVEFYEILESKYLEAAGSEAKENFAKSLVSIKEDYDKKQKASFDKTMNALNDLEKKLQG